MNYPTSSAEETGLGGSEFMGDGTAENPQTGSGTYWSATGYNDLVTSAKSYIPEMAWNDTAFDIANGGGLSAGGGGVSILFAKPSWQAGVPGIPADGHRDVPDISIDASADHDGYLICTEIVLDSASTGAATPSCSSGFRISDPALATIRDSASSVELRSPPRRSRACWRRSSKSSGRTGQYRLRPIYAGIKLHHLRFGFP